MPDRYVRCALLGSPSWQALPNAEARLLFVRLILLADDFGVFDGRPEVIAAHAYPAALVTPEQLTDVEQNLAHLYRAGLVVRFSNNGKPYIAVWQWGNDLRGSRRFPAPPIDVDLEGMRVRGKFGKEVGWQNPAGCAAVSILLDYDGRAVTPQPDEWRPPDHMRANPNAKSGWKRELPPQVTGGVRETAQLQAARDTQPVTSSLLQAASDRLLNTGGSVARVVTPEEVSPVVVSPETPAPPATAANGSIKFDGGQWIGVTEGQRLSWQQTFETLSVPVQLDRMAAWLTANPAEARANELHGYEQFIVRWLLKESRTSSQLEPVKH